MSDHANHWIPAQAFMAMGFKPTGPEIDYGMTWEQGRVRVSFAPFRDRDGGFLYAHDRMVDKYQLLHADITQEQVDTAWELLKLGGFDASGYRDLPRLLGDGPLPVRPARDLLLHCIDSEAHARADYQRCIDTPYRMDAGRSVTIRRAARTAAEDLLTDAVGAEAPRPVVVTYRATGTEPWIGRISGIDLDDAKAAVRELDAVVSNRSADLHILAVHHGGTSIPTHSLDDRVVTTPSLTPSL